MEENGTFTEEQLKNMNKENLAKVILLMQKQEKKQKAQVEKQEKETARLQQKQQLLEDYLEHVLDKLRFIPEFENTEKVRALLPWSSDIPNSCKTPFQK